MFIVRPEFCLAQVLDTIESELRTQYALGFVPMGGEGKFHKLELRCTRPGVTVRTRSGYFAP